MTTCAFRLPDSKAVFLVDAQDAPLIKAHEWGLVNSRGMVYVATKIDGRRVFLHRLIMNPPPGKIVDHISGETLDNRRGNLRVCTHAENLRNAKLRAHSRTGVKGVQWASKGRGRFAWRACVRVDKRVHRKWFPATPEGKLAAEEWAIEMRIELHGAFARHK